MRIIRAIYRFFFIWYWRLTVSKKWDCTTVRGWDFIVNGKDQYIGYVLHGERNGTTITMPMHFNRPYTNLYYAVVDMMFLWFNFRAGYKPDSEGRIKDTKHD